MARKMTPFESCNCPLCGKPASKARHLPSNDWEVQCERCGNYLTNCYETLVNSHGGKNLIGLSGIARSYHERREKLFLTDENRADYERMAPRFVIDKAKRLLQAIASRTTYPS